MGAHALDSIDRRESYPTRVWCIPYASPANGYPCGGILTWPSCREVTTFCRTAPRTQEVCRTGATLPRPVSVVLPSDQVTLESLEGMLVSIKRPVVTENYNADSFGEIVLAAGRQWQFTQASFGVRATSS